MGHDAMGTPSMWPELDALVTELVSAHQAVAQAQAHETRLLSAAIDLVMSRASLPTEPGRHTSADMALREVSAEVGAALRLSDRAVQRRLGNAATLVSDYPTTLAMWECGAIDGGHVAAILDAGIGIDDATLRGRFEQHVLEAAQTETAGRLQSIARAIAARVDPDGAAERIRRGQDDRQVRVVDLPDGMARLLADLPAVLAHAIGDRLTRLAHEVKANESAGDAVVSEPPLEASDDASSLAVGGACHDARPTGPTGTNNGSDGGPLHIAVRTGPSEDGRARAGRPQPEPVPDAVASAPPEDTRTIGQLRADILADLLLAGGPLAHGSGLDAVTGHVQVTIPVLTLAGVDNEPALLAGHGPVESDTARRLAGSAPGWDRVFTHPCTGAVLAVDRYRPSADLARHLRARDERCRFPGCIRPSSRSDIDHTIDAAMGGPTQLDNLSHLCRRHHTLKHATAWTVRQRPGGILEWTSPTGRTHVDRPPATVRFVPAKDDPPPF